MSGTDEFSMNGVLYGQLTVVLESLDEKLAGCVGRHVLNNDDCGREFRGQLAGQFAQGAEAAGGCPDHNESSPDQFHRLEVLPSQPAVWQSATTWHSGIYDSVDDATFARQYVTPEIEILTP